ncbi:hypothetical protein AWC38_SpisGene12595 [Stylophora pistillata]|uniref:Rho termination factor-like N-terminal domain-containing protein n=1 Tax=Stylophora pistillata TaxID=50429 RepID=A0A2B4S2S7_STYPI|nr:hypothetical protein AWC38_SpisGene12595 [Stylophora pistillata]
MSELNSQTVLQLKALAKHLGLRGYSRLRKAELIAHIEELTKDDYEEVVVIEEEPIVGGSLLDDPIPEHEILKEQKIMKPTKATKLIKKKKKIDKVVKWGKKKVEDWGKWLKEIESDEPRVVVDDELKDFKAHIAKLYKRDEHHFNLVERKSLKKHIGKMYTIDGEEGYDPIDFFQAVKPTVIKFLLTQKNIKIEFVLRCNMAKTNIDTGETVLLFTYFHSYQEIIFQETDREEIYNRSIVKMMENMAKFTRNGSGWTVDSIAGLDLHTIEYKPLKGSSYIKLDSCLAKKKAIVNMKNEDDECFKWCVARALNPVKKDQERITKILKEQAKKLKWDGIKFPMEVKDIYRFETLNPGIAVNVFGYERGLYPIRVSNVEKVNTRIRLLLISEEEKKHYCLIKSMSRLISSQLSKNGHKKFICDRCLNYFGSQKVLDTHDELCRDHEAVREKMPKPKTFLFFKNHHRKIDLPFVIYADFESIIKPLNSAQPFPEKCYTEKKHLHIPVSFCYYIKCSFDDQYSKLVEYIAKSEDEDVAQIFVNMLEEEVHRIYKNHPPKKMIFTKNDAEIFEKATCCWICEEEFEEGEEKVRDHCHFTGKFRRAAHNSCNLSARQPKFIPVIFHNLANYDAHLFIRNLGVSEGDIKCIPNNEEKYISFTKKIKVGEFFDETKGHFVDVNRELRFIDSFKFMGSKLDDLVKNLVKEDNTLVNTGKYHTGEKLELLKRKGEFPYEWFDSIYKLDETELPPIEKWFSSLSGEGISEEGFCHAHKVKKTFGMKTFRDYLKLYNQSDVLLLADVFENFRKVCKKHYDLDPCWYFTLPGLAWDAMLKLTKRKLELLSDINMLHMFEKGIRGGTSMIPTRYSKANNKYMGEKFDPAQPSKFITYLDANNLYGWAMSKSLPTGGFEWMDEKDFNEWEKYSCILEVYLLPIKEEQLDYFDHYPPAPENRKINKVPKLLCTLNEKKKYIIHHETLRMYKSLRVEIGKIHRVIKFEESPWMKPYIDLNTSLRAKADNDFEKDFFKLMNNAVYGKTMENIRKRVDVRLTNSEHTIKRLANKVNFKHCTIFSENLCAIEMRKTKITFDKPLYLGMCILDLSKILMYDFHYNYIKAKYGDRAKLLMTDTDSLCYEIQTDDFYQDIKSDVHNLFDTSNIPKDHPSGIPSGVNKKVIGMFKDEAGGKIIEEFVGLRAKLYCYKMFEDGKEEKKCKGVKKNVTL